MKTPTPASTSPLRVRTAVRAGRLPTRHYASWEVSGL